MANVTSITNSEVWSFAQILLIRPYSNADPERLFSMVRKIETEERRQLDPSKKATMESLK